MHHRPFSLLLLGLLLPSVAFAQAPPATELTKDDRGWTLLRDGKPFMIKGAGGGASKKLLAELGAN